MGHVYEFYFGLCWSVCSVVILVDTSRQVTKAASVPGLRARIQQADTNIDQQYFGKPKELHQIQLDVTTAISEVDPQFLSVAIGAGRIKENWSGIPFTSRQFINLARGLSPAMLRVGGSDEDFLIFNSSGDKTTDKRAIHWREDFTMTPQQWDEVNKFVETVGWDFVFGLNALLRTPYPNGSWDSDNARMLLSYSTSRNYTVQWELGNGVCGAFVAHCYLGINSAEPVLWKTPIPAAVHAKDYFSLQELVLKENALGQMLIGPDSKDLEYFVKFIESLPHGILNATTYHQYYKGRKKASVERCYEVHILDKFIDQAISFQTSTEALQPQADVWLGETSSFFDGGAPNISNTYVAGFMWLDKLGIAAIVGHKRVFRQTFVGGSYALLDKRKLPLPDYWLSLLYKKLVGTEVLYVKGCLEYGRYLRSYAHCAKPPYPAGSVVLLLLNTNFSEATVELLNEELVSSERDVFWLSPPAGNLTSTSVLLNGVLLELVDNTDLPDLVPAEESPSPSLSLPSISFGFIVFKNTKLPACL